MNYFVGGYYDSRKFKGDFFEGKTPFSNDIDIYTLDEVLKLGFVEPVNEWYNETKDDNELPFDELSEEEQSNAIIEYVEGDEIAGIIYFDSLDAAKKYKENVLNELSELEKVITYAGQEQDEYGYFKDVYIYRDNS